MRFIAPKVIVWPALMIIVGIQFVFPGTAAAIVAQTAVGATDVFLGETFQMQIQISGSDQPGQADLSGLTDFTVQPAGGRQNNSSSVTIINGRMTQDIQKSYLMDFQLTPKRIGRLVIPSITLTVEGETVRTNPVAINVQKPMDIENFKLVLELSKRKVFVGEPVQLRMVWYVGQNVRNARFNLPVLNNNSVSSASPRFIQNPGIEYVRIGLGTEEVIAVKSQGRLDGKDYTTVGFEKILIPNKTGVIPIDPATVAFEVLAGVRQNRSPGFFSDVFGSRNQEVYRKQVIPSNALALEVADLPNEGRPANFSGYVGNYRVETTAVPTDVNVGDPITLTIALSGPEYLDHISLPPLQEQLSLARDFKIPAEMEAGKFDGVRKVFTQTVRARRSDIQAIPSIELPYFDTDSATYKVARSEPISISVRETKVVTASDAEGLSASNPAASAVEAWTRGIAHNYEDLDAIVNQEFGPENWLRSPAWVSVIGAPPLVYAILLAGVVFVRRRNSDPLALRSRLVFTEVSRELAAIQRNGLEPSSDAVLDCLRRYLGGKLRMSHGALTYKDVDQLMIKKGVDSSDLEELKELMKMCEANRFAGGNAGGDPGAVAGQCISLVKKLEQVLK